jgi:hypothetical protein
MRILTDLLAKEKPDPVPHLRPPVPTLGHTVSDLGLPIPTVRPPIPHVGKSNPANQAAQWFQAFTIFLTDLSQLSYISNTRENAKTIKKKLNKQRD